MINNDFAVVEQDSSKNIEGEIFQVDEALVKVSPTIKCLIDELGIENVISLSDISSKTLSRIIDYVKKHAEFNVAASMTSMSDKKSIEAWEAEFMKADMDTIYELIQVSFIFSCLLNFLAFLFYGCSTIDSDIYLFVLVYSLIKIRVIRI